MSNKKEIKLILTKEGKDCWEFKLYVNGKLKTTAISAYKETATKEGMYYFMKYLKNMK
jgi:hypothetical protein